MLASGLENRRRLIDCSSDRGYGLSLVYISMRSKTGLEMAITRRQRESFQHRGGKGRWYWETLDGLMAALPLPSYFWSQ